jgi:YVTN family beta-propeller protein
LTLKDINRTTVFDARPPFSVLKSLDTGPITNHVNLVNNANGAFAYVTIGGLNEVRVFRTDDFSQVATIPVGRLPHGIWPSGDGTRVYVGLENDDAVSAIDTLTNKVIATSPIGQAPQALTYVANAVAEGDGMQGLQPLGLAGETTRLTLAPIKAGNAGCRPEKAPTSVALFEQGLTQVLQAAVTGLQPKQSYVLALAHQPNGEGEFEPLATFMTNPAGSAIVNAVGPTRQIVRGDGNEAARRHLVIRQGDAAKSGPVVQVQSR